MGHDFRVGHVVSIFGEGLLRRFEGPSNFLISTSGRAGSVKEAALLEQLALELLNRRIPAKLYLGWGAVSDGLSGELKFLRYFPQGYPQIPTLLQVRSASSFLHVCAHSITESSVLICANSAYCRDHSSS